MEGRILTAVRLVVHWATGAVIGLGIEHDAWTRGATLALGLYLLAQGIGYVMNARRKRA